MSKATCLACKRKIDDAAKVCPYCGADPATGQKAATDPIVQELFQPRKVSASESVIEYARQRQGVVIAVGAGVLFLLLAVLHQFVTMRNAQEVTAAPAVPLTEVTDLSNQPDETKPQPMPDIKFQYDGRPQVMRTMIVEPGAVTPPEVIAEQQAAQQAAQQKLLEQQQKQQGTPAQQQPGAAPSAAAPAPAAPPQTTTR